MAVAVVVGVEGDQASLISLDMDAEVGAANQENSELLFRPTWSRTFSWKAFVRRLSLM